MTRAQRLELLKQIEKDIHVCSLESTFLDDAKSCAIHSAIEELEQEPILDKIRAEIEQTASRYSISRERVGMGQVEWSDRLIKESEVLQILDKYEAESVIEKRKEWPHKPCINYEDGCEERAGCPCVYYEAESEAPDEDQN